MARHPVEHQRALALQRLRRFGQARARHEMPPQRGRTSTSNSTDTTRNTAPCTHRSSTSRLEPAAASAAAEHEQEQVAGQRFGPGEANAAISQISGTGMRPAYRVADPMRG